MHYEEKEFRTYTSNSADMSGLLIGKPVTKVEPEIIAQMMLLEEQNALVYKMIEELQHRLSAVTVPVGVSISEVACGSAKERQQSELAQRIASQVEHVRVIASKIDSILRGLEI